MKITTRKRSVFLLLAVFMAILFNAPLLNAVNQAATAEGSSSLFLYMMISWLILIGIVAVAVSFKPTDRKRPS